jgi:agmatine deiminase
VNLRTSIPALYMPPEWERHDRCWMSWPCNRALWGDALADARRCFAELVHTVATFEPVSLLAARDDIRGARALCAGENVEIIEAELDDSWLRDSGPTFVRDARGVLCAVAWQFNAYGQKYPHARDRDLPALIAGRAGAPLIRVPLATEGGAISTDGAGTLLCTKSCILDPRRNPGITIDAAERLLCDALGARQVIWLERGLTDDTDGHVDEVACFAGPGRILALVQEDPDDVDYLPLQANLERLRSARSAAGAPYTVITVAAPRVLVRAGRRLSRSYVNFYLANGAVVMPRFGDEIRDDAALRILESTFADRRVVAVDTSALAIGGGNIHCVTQQQPTTDAAASAAPR